LCSGTCERLAGPSSRYGKQFGKRERHYLSLRLMICATVDLQAEADTPGVSFMSGFSPQVLTDFMENGVLGSGPEVHTVTPWETLSARLARPRLDAVRALVARVQEGPMAGYVAPTRADDAAEDDAMKTE
jgi:hypothetical protein